MSDVTITDTDSTGDGPTTILTAAGQLSELYTAAKALAQAARALRGHLAFADLARAATDLAEIDAQRAVIAGLLQVQVQE